MPTNLQRAVWAEAALSVFTHEVFQNEHPATMGREDCADAISDLICDLLHYAQTAGLDPFVLHARALRAYQTERTTPDTC